MVSRRTFLGTAIAAAALPILPAVAESSIVVPPTTVSISTVDWGPFVTWAWAGDSGEFLGAEVNGEPVRCDEDGSLIWSGEGQVWRFRVKVRGVGVLDVDSIHGHVVDEDWWGK